MYRFFIYISAIMLLALPVTSATAQIRDHLRITIMCADIDELARGLDQVAEETQVYFNSQDIWRGSRGCVRRSFHEDTVPNSDVFVGWYLTEPTRSNGRRFWVPIHAVQLKAKGPKVKLLPGITIQEETLMVRPSGAFRADQWGLPEDCERRWVERRGRREVVRIYGADGVGPFDYCGTPIPTGDEFRESRRNRRR